MKVITIGKKFDFKFDFRETCFGIVVKDNKILLVKKNDQYSLIGGGMDFGETFEECIKREFLEEAGMLPIKILPLVCIDCFWLAANKYPMESKANIFCVDVDLLNKIKPTEEGHTIEWINIEQAKDLLPLPYHKEALNYYFLNKTNTIKLNFYKNKKPSN